MAAQTMPRDEAIAVLHRLGRADPIPEAERELSDLVPMHDIEEFGARHGMTADSLKSRMGGSP